MEVKISVLKEPGRGSKTDIHIIEASSQKKVLKSSDIGSKKYQLTIGGAEKQDHKVTGEIIKQLVILGYSLECINLVNSRYKFKTVDQALRIMCKDPETGLYPHLFYPKVQSCDDEVDDHSNHAMPIPNTTCIICKDKKEMHYNPQVEDRFQAALPSMILGETEQNLVNREDNIKEFLNEYGLTKTLPNNNNNIQNKIDSAFIDNLEKQFLAKNLCIICYANELNEQCSYKFPCGHTFCYTCIKSYLLNLINTAHVESMKCMMAGCKSIISDTLIKEMISHEEYQKYTKFRKRMIFAANTQKGLIPCVYPDCQEWVCYRDGEEPFVLCEQGHEFCARCKEKWHKKKNCKNFELEKIIQKNSKIKPCPNCSNLIEKSDGCNHVICSICGYEFCWLCMRKYAYYHYYVFNVRGCPGMRYAHPTPKSIWNKPFFKCIWFILTFLLAILAIAVIIVLFLIFGAGYEFIKCYNDGKKKHSEDDSEFFRSEIDYLSDLSYQKKSNVSNKCYNNNNNNNKQQLEQTKCKRYSMYALLLLLGLFVQPFFLLFKLIEILMECYRRFGCWFYYFST